MSPSDTLKIQIEVDRAVVQLQEGSQHFVNAPLSGGSEFEAMHETLPSTEITGSDIRPHVCSGTQEGHRVLPVGYGPTVEFTLPLPVRSIGLDLI